MNFKQVDPGLWTWKLNSRADIPCAKIALGFGGRMYCVEVRRRIVVRPSGHRGECRSILWLPIYYTLDACIAYASKLYFGVDPYSFPADCDLTIRWH